MSACCTARPTSRSAATTGRPGPNARQGSARRASKLFPGDRTAPPGAAALFMIGMNIAAEHEHEFNEWYNTEHIPALGSVPGVLCARRYRGTGGTQRYVALYHLTAPRSCAQPSGGRRRIPRGRKKCGRISATCYVSSAAAISARSSDSPPAKRGEVRLRLLGGRNARLVASQWCSRCGDVVETRAIVP